MSVHSTFTSSSSFMGYVSEGNQLRKPITPPTAAAMKSNASPFASIFAEQKKPSASANTTGMNENFSKQLIMPPNAQASSREIAARANTIAKVDMDKQRMQALEQMGQNIKSSDSLIDVARNDVTMRNLRSAIGSFSLKAPVMPMENSIKSGALQQAQRNMRLDTSVPDRDKSIPIQSQAKAPTIESPELGKLSSQFESGKDGIAAIGYDRVGGTSYGKYQIASRVGSMDKFLTFLDTNASDIAEQLREAGPANTGGRKGGMPNEWRKIAEEQPERFEALQDKFIYESHYKPALAAISAQTPMNEDKISSVMQEVLWSTAVQHGPTGAARIFNRATARSGDHEDKNYDQRVINNIYAIRAEQFGSSTEAVQNAVRNRMHREKNLALNMLRENTNGVA